MKPYLLASVFLGVIVGLAFAILSCLTGCTTVNGVKTVDPLVLSGLSLIQTSAAAVASSGALTGKTAGIIADVSTISAGLETILSGQSITVKQASDVAASFKSNSATTSYAQLAVPIVNALVSAVNETLNKGGTPAEAQANGVAILVAAPPAVAAAIDPGPTTLNEWKNDKMFAHDSQLSLALHANIVRLTPHSLRPPLGERDPFNVRLAKD